MPRTTLSSPYFPQREIWAFVLQRVCRSRFERHCPPGKKGHKTLRMGPTISSPDFRKVMQTTHRDAVKPKDHRHTWAARSDPLGAQAATFSECSSGGVSTAPHFSNSYS